MADVYDAFNQREINLSRISHDKKKYQENHYSFNISDIHHGCQNVILGYLIHHFVGNFWAFCWITFFYHLSSAAFYFLTWKCHTQEYQRENWETTHYLEGELREMVDIYMNQYQVSSEDAWDILKQMSRYQKLFVDHMMVLELDIKPPKINFDDFALSNAKYTFSGISGMLAGYTMAYLPYPWTLPIINSGVLWYFYQVNTFCSISQIATYCLETSVFFGLISLVS